MQRAGEGSRADIAGMTRLKSHRVKQRSPVFPRLGAHGCRALPGGVEIATPWCQDH